jgi:hypothetical protein
MAFYIQLPFATSGIKPLVTNLVEVIQLCMHATYFAPNQCSFPCRQVSQVPSIDGLIISIYIHLGHTLVP